jgi:hypothetical protein
MTCDEDPNDAVMESTFDLEKIGQNGYQNLDVAFYSNLEDLTLEENPLKNKYTSGDTTIYVRLEKDNQCIGVEQIDLVVSALPNFEFTDSHEICTDGEELQLQAPIGFDSYAWYKIDENRIEKIGENNDIDISEGGTYTIEVGTNHEKNGQMVTCTASRDFIIIPSNKAVIQEIKIEDASNNNSIEIIVSGDGDYEFSLDGRDYQNANTFKNIDAGFYTIFVRDKSGCGVSEEEIAVMGIPKFFTPNGDGFNDQWQLIGHDQNEMAARISISSGQRSVS